MTTLTREALLGKTKRRYQSITIGQNETARIQSLNEAEVSEWDATGFEPKTYKCTPAAMARRRRMLVALSLVDDAGKRLFGSDECDQLSDIDGKVFAMIHAAAIKLNSLDDDESAAVEDEVKN